MECCFCAITLFAVLCIIGVMESAVETTKVDWRSFFGYVVDCICDNGPIGVCLRSVGGDGERRRLNRRRHGIKNITNRCTFLMLNKVMSLKHGTFAMCSCHIKLLCYFLVEV